MKFLTWLPRALRSSLPMTDITGMPYLNVSHTDFDLPKHFDWTARSGVRSIYLIHDLIPIRHPQFSRPHAVQRHQGRVRRALKHGGQIVTSSRAVADDLEAFAQSEGLEMPPVLVAPIAGETFTPPSNATKPSPAYFLCAGTIEPRKNHQLLCDVWHILESRMGAKTPQLIIAGQTGPLTGDILASFMLSPKVAPFVDLSTTCSDSELAGLMHDAAALLMPSLAEGYGLPIVEALNLGTPVIASDSAIFREIGQGLPQFIAPDDAAAWATAIEEISTFRADVYGKSASVEGSGMASSKAKRAAQFSAPSWAAHFELLDSVIAAPDAPASLKTASAYESNLAA